MGKKSTEWKEKILHSPHLSLRDVGGEKKKDKFFYTQELVFFFLPTLPISLIKDSTCFA